MTFSGAVFGKYCLLNLHTALCLPCTLQESTIEFVAAKISELLAEDQQQQQQQQHQEQALSGASAGGGVDRTNDADYGKEEVTAGRQQGTSSSAVVGASGGAPAAGAGSTGGASCGNERTGLLAPSGRETGSAGGKFKRMYLISTYTIGKERILMQVCGGQWVRESSTIWLVCAR